MSKSNNGKIQSRRKGALARRENDIVILGKLIAGASDKDAKSGYEAKLEIAQTDVANLKKNLGNQVNA